MMKRVHRQLAEAVLQNLILIFNENQKADQVIQSRLKSNPKWGSRDRRFIAENTYDIIRWWRLLKFSVEINERKFKDEQNFWKMIGGWLIIQGYELPEWEEFRALEAEKVLANYAADDKSRKVRESIPDWLDELGEKEVPNWDAELAELNQPSEVFIRVNTLKTNLEELKKVLAKEGVEVDEVANVHNALRLKKRQKIDHLKSYRKGLFEVQDAGSQKIVEYLAPEEGAIVIDACAGAGGKSLYLAALMQNSGQIISTDVEKRKLKELNIRAKRNGVDIIKTSLIDQDFIDQHSEKADYLLLDVPCSGTGVLKRNPDAKWKLKPSFLEEIVQTQQQILNDYTKLLKSGGVMVYATCSLLKSENEAQIERFLSLSDEFTLEKEERVSPAKTGFDGFYMARLKKK